MSTHPTSNDAGAPTALEIAHVLFMDIVAYSKLPMEQQTQRIADLQHIVRGTAEFSRAQKRHQLLRLPTGDGMALVFFGDVAAPVRCAVEVSRALREHPDLKLRMGINSGPVQRVEDINANRNVAGGGINMAQRVMDCGDDGHILTSKSVADALAGMSAWAGTLHDLGEVAVKHGVLVHVFNLYTAEVGNSQKPQKLRVAARHKALLRGVLVCSALAVCTLAYVAWYFLIHHRVREYAVAPVKGRRSIAVLGFKNLSGKSDVGWLGTTLSESLTTELAAGENLRTIPEENVARMKTDLGLPESDSLATDTLAAIHKNLGSDLVVLGSYLDQSGQVRLDVRLQDAAKGETLDSAKESGSEGELFELVSRVGAEIRAKCGVADITRAESAEVKASSPVNPEAIRLYAEGLARLRAGDALSARDLFQRVSASDPGFALAHSELAEAWSKLGYGQKAIEEAGRAVDLSTNLPREEQLSIQGQYRASKREWSAAVESYGKLFASFPDSVDYGLRLAAAQTSAGKPQDALSTLAALRRLASPEGDDPRIDLAEASAADAQGDYPRQLQAAKRAAEKGNASGARFVIARGLRAEGFALLALGDREPARAVLKQADDLYIALGDKSGRPLIIIGNMLSEQGDYDKAVATYQQALREARETGDKQTECFALTNIGHVHVDQGNFAAAKPLYIQALGIQRATEDKKNVGSTLSNLGRMLYAAGDYAESSKMLEESLSIAREVGNRRSEAYVQGFRSELLYSQGDLAESKSSAEESLRISREIGHKRALESALSDIGTVLLAQGDFSGAQKQQEDALTVAKEIGEKRSAAMYRVALAQVSLEKGLPSEAEALVRDPVEEFRTDKSRGFEALAEAVLVQSLLAQNDVAGARKAMESAKAAAAGTQDHSVRFEVDLTEALLRASSGQALSAEGNLRAIISTAKKIGCLPCELEARLALGEIEMKTARHADGRERLEQLQRDAASKGFLLIAKKAANAVPQ
jgi:eukaryotic-like serine/threonine-protein kinase